MSQAGLVKFTDNILPPDVATSYDANIGVAIPLSNILNIVGGSGITTSATGNTLTITATASGFAWNVVTSANNPVTLVPENGYICKGAGSVNFILPPAASIGDMYKIIGYGNLWSIAQNAGQSITIGFVTSTLGVGGSIAASMISDNITLTCVSTNTEFYETGIQGNPFII